MLELCEVMINLQENYIQQTKLHIRFQQKVRVPTPRSCSVSGAVAIIGSQSTFVLLVISGSNLEFRWTVLKFKLESKNFNFILEEFNWQMCCRERRIEIRFITKSDFGIKIRNEIINYIFLNKYLSKKVELDKTHILLHLLYTIWKKCKT